MSDVVFTTADNFININDEDISLDFSAETIVFEFETAGAPGERGIQGVQGPQGVQGVPGQTTLPDVISGGFF